MNTPNSSIVFPSWVDELLRGVGLVLAIAGGYVVVLVTFGASPDTISVGYAPKQPVPYSHKLHVGELGLDCRYCHTPVEEGAHATIPPTQTCMNCHSNVKTESPLLEPVRNSFKTGMPVEWVRVHDLPDYVYFNHSAHVTRGVGCAECHGRVDKMEVVRQEEPLSMGWCLKCHRDPAPRLRPKDKITEMDWGHDKTEAERREIGEKLKQEYRLNPSTDCTTCHR